MTDYKELENPDNPIYSFILDNEKADTSLLLLKYHDKELPFSLEFAVDQIICRRKTSKKIPSFLSQEQFIFPDIISSEQASDERVAEYHAELTGSGKVVLDMTAGLGIDAMSIAMRGNNVTACDIDHHKSNALSHNAKILNIRNLRPICTDSTTFLNSIASKVDIIFVDPARRDADNRRTYSFADCSPDIVKLLPLMLSKANRIFVKSSPLLDITQILKEIPVTSYIHIVCVKGECKEVLVEIAVDTPFHGIRIIDLHDTGIISDFMLEKDELILTEAPVASCEDLKTGQFLYEPNAGLMKIRPYGALCSRFPDMKHIAKNTALLVSGKYHPDFPGRVLRIDDFPDKEGLKNLYNGKYCIVTRNYLVEADTLRKKLRVKEGTDKFIYAFRATLFNRNVICIATKL